MSTVLAFILTLAVLVIVHEYGHYRVARACGVKVNEKTTIFLRAVDGYAAQISAAIASPIYTTTV